MHQKLFRLLLCFISLTSLKVHADAMYESPFSLAVGGAGQSSVTELDAIDKNPSLLAGSERSYIKTVLFSPFLSFSSNAKTLADQLQTEGEDQTEILKNQIGKAFSLSASSTTALMLKHVAVGFAYHLEADAKIHKSAELRGAEALAANFHTNQTFFMSVYDQFGTNGNTKVGATFKSITRNDGQIEASLLDAENLSNLMEDDELLRKGRGRGLDLALTQTYPSARFAHVFSLVLKDLGNTTFDPLDETMAAPDAFKQSFNLGYTYVIRTQISKLELMADALDIFAAHETKLSKRLKLGASIDIKEAIGMQVGIGDGYFSGGGYLNLRFVRLDLGAYTKETGAYASRTPDQRYFLRAVFAI